MKEFITWSGELSVGIEEIDEQHKVLIGLINRMHDAIHQRHGSDVVESILPIWPNIPVSISPWRRV